jgi:hypothetical protein
MTNEVTEHAFDWKSYADAYGITAMKDFEKLVATNPIVRMCYAGYRSMAGAASFETMLLSCVINLAKQNEELGKQLADTISSKPHPMVIQLPSNATKNDLDEIRKKLGC